MHPDDVEVVLETVSHSTEQHEPFVLEYRIVRADGEVRWVLDRGQPVPGPGGRLWLDGALFDITERRAAEAALLAHKVEAARTAELRASRQRILEAADAARRKIERDLHDGAQQRLVVAGPRRPGRAPAAGQGSRRRSARSSSGSATSSRRPRPSCASSRAASIPAVLTERGLVAAIGALATRSPFPVEVVDPPDRSASRPRSRRPRTSRSPRR